MEQCTHVTGQGPHIYYGKGSIVYHRKWVYNILWEKGPVVYHEKKVSKCKMRKV